MSDALLKNTFKKISPAYELVADVTIATATTQVDFNGLNFGKDDDLLLVHDVSKTSGSDVIYVNGNTTLTNYYSQTLRADATSVTGYRSNNSVISPTAGGGGRQQLVITNIKLTNNGYFTYQSHAIQYRDGTSPYAQNFDVFGTSTFTMSSITSIRIQALSANDIPAGSRFQLYRLKAKKVVDIIISSATTQVDITGLSIDKDSEYMLVSDVNNTSGSNASNYLCANGNNTLTNYYAQYIMASNTTLDSARSNTSFMCRTNLGQKVLSIQKIKLTNNGYFTFQSDAIRQYGDSTCELQKSYGTSTFTMTSATSLSIVSSVSNGIGIGSRFTLYKMK